jgi:ketosteroid isomerase-like protein
MKRALMLGSTVAIAMIIAASPIRVSAKTGDTAEITTLEQRLIDGKPFDSTFRIKDVYRKSQGKWVIVQEHISEPPHAARW